MIYLKKNLVTIVLCLITSLAFAYTCNTPASSGDDGNGGDNGGTPPVSCSDNPFGETCGPEFMSARVTACTMGDTATSNTACATLFTEASASVNTCFTDPYADACSVEDGAFTTYAETARTNRTTFCADNAGNSLCDTLTLCNANPYATQCEAYFEDTRVTNCLANNMADDSCRGSSGIINTFCTAGENLFSTETACATEELQLARVTACTMGDTATSNTACATLFTEASASVNTCFTDPYADACSVEDGAFTTYAETARTNRTTFCADNAGNSLCDTLTLCNANPYATQCEAYFETARTNLCGGSTVSSTCVNVGDLPTYPLKPIEVTASGFLTATDTGLNMTDIQFESSSFIRTVLTSFTGRRGGAGTAESPNTNPDGFAYLITTSTSSASFGYAGILSTTNLGAPLASAPTTVVWAGHFKVGSRTIIPVNFYVDFTNGEFGFRNNDMDDSDKTLPLPSGTTIVYTMNAVFGSHTDASSYSAGRMGGTLVIADGGFTINSTITGLIGAEGAVGVFTKVGAVSDAGGFTATNP